MNGAASKPTTPELTVYAATKALKWPGPMCSSRISCGPSGIRIMKSTMCVNCTAASSRSRRGSVSGFIYPREKLSLAPAATDGLDQLNRCDQALTGELRIGALGGKRVAAGIDDFQITDEAGAIAIGGEVSGAPG